jgi:patatin-like phospholipase
MHPFWKPFFIDTPGLIDSSWRRIDLILNSECSYQWRNDPPPDVVTRPFWHKPPFWFFAVTVLFVSFGPTWDGLCATAPKHMDVLRQDLAWVVIIGSLVLAYFAGRGLINIVDHRFKTLTERNELTRYRRVMIIVIAAIEVLALIGVGVGLGYYLHLPADTACGVSDWSGVAIWRLVLCALAIGTFAVISGFRFVTVQWLVVIQAAIVSAVAAIQWFVLATADGKEAADLPYRHVFEFWAPCIVATLIFAPCIAQRVFAAGEGVGAASGRLRELLKGQELFVRPQEPDSSWRRIFHAVVYGPAYHPLHLLLLPSLVTLVAAAEWLNFLVAIASGISFMLLVWGNVYSRWQQLNTYIERWFLRGTPLLISLLVILVAILRVAQVNYVSAILDAAPFGTVFGFIMMNYVLFWLVEYWVNRVAAVQILDVLGETVEDEVAIRYEPTFPVPHVPANEEVQVVRQGRLLLSHDTGRFIVVGAIGSLGDPPPPPPQAGQEHGPQPAQQQGVPAHAPPRTAFQSYYLMELVTLLGDSTGRLQNHEAATEINQRTGTYFFWMNLMTVAVTVAFAYLFLQTYFGSNAADPVVNAQAAPPLQQTVDLRDLLIQRPGLRPAVVVVGSGGGTRAALYTASVLNGLHRLGVDRDIVLLSGVSGGGLALAYFAAHRDELLKQSLSSPGPCSDDAWGCFIEGVTKPFIEDVLNGAMEWRLFGTVALSELLVESFERKLFTSRLGSATWPALILNTTIVSHPAEDSDLLTGTLEPASDCGEAERTFKLMSGGRLIFTNLRDTEGFPQRQSAIPDVRLPFQIVRDPDVPLAAAAALNANFPPVFPNGRVRIHSNVPEPCKNRSYYVTDGGMVENLGLVSALYALKSALDKIPADTAVRPIHVVIAEASAASYDYSQDRGLASLFGESKERLTGGLTGQLIDEIRLPRPDHAKAEIDFHYLVLPLAFRARGGMGTHWLYSKQYTLHDPRPRETSWLHPAATSTVKRKDVEALWLALHDPDKSFCTDYAFPKDSSRATVQKWICGPDQHELHLKEWGGFVKAMRQ